MCVNNDLYIWVHLFLKLFKTDTSKTVATEMEIHILNKLIMFPSSLPQFWK